mgnify:CR=1 FL=1
MPSSRVETRVAPKVWSTGPPSKAIRASARPPSSNGITRKPIVIAAAPPTFAAAIVSRHSDATASDVGLRSVRMRLKSSSAIGKSRGRTTSSAPVASMRAIASGSPVAPR